MILVNPSHFASNPWKHFWMGPTLVFSHKLFCRSRPYLQFWSWPQPKNCFPGFGLRAQFFFSCTMCTINRLIDLYPHIEIRNSSAFSHELSWCDPSASSWQWNLFHTCHTWMAMSAFSYDCPNLVATQSPIHIHYKHIVCHRCVLRHAHQKQTFWKKPHHNGDIFCPSFLCAHCSYEGFCDSLARTSYHSNRTWWSFLRAVSFHG